VLAEAGTPGFGVGQDSEPLKEALADVVEQEALQGASETVEEATAAVVNDESRISELEQEDLPRGIEEAAVQEEAPAEVLCESPDDKLQPTRLLEQYGLEDEGDELVSALGAPAPEETSEPVQEAGEKAPAEEGSAAPDAQDAVEESVEASDSMADAVTVADEDASARVAESAPVEHESAGLPDAQDGIAESTVVAELLEPLAEGVVEVESAGLPDAQDDITESTVVSSADDLSIDVELLAKEEERAVRQLKARRKKKPKAKAKLRTSRQPLAPLKEEEEEEEEVPGVLSFSDDSKDWKPMATPWDKLEGHGNTVAGCGDG
jgi:hypothetical protein